RRNRRDHPVVTLLCVELIGRCRKLWIFEVPHEDAHSLFASERPVELGVQRGTTRRTEVEVVNALRPAVGGPFAADLCVVSLHLAVDRDDLFRKEHRTHAEHAAGSLLTEPAMAEGDEQRFALHGDLDAPARTLSRSCCHCPSPRVHSVRSLRGDQPVLTYCPLGRTYASSLAR